VEKQLEASVRAAITFLENHNFRYAIIGGIALAQWNVIRATYDIDIKVLVPNNNYASIRTTLQTAFPHRARLQGPENPLIVAVTINNIVVDFLLALPGYEELIIERAIQRDLDGWSAWICSAEDLIIQKVVAGRGKDWLDVEALLIEQRGKLEEIYIEDWLTQFAEVLEKPEMLAEYHRLLTQSKKLRK
jgi:predicted nucleotidyltransferase